MPSCQELGLQNVVRIYTAIDMSITDPFLIAAETASFVVCNGSSNMAGDAAESMPIGSTSFERGMAAGLAIAMAHGWARSEPETMHP